MRKVIVLPLSISTAKIIQLVKLVTLVHWRARAVVFVPAVVKDCGRVYAISSYAVCGWSYSKI